MERLKDYFTSKGVSASDFPKGVIIHELLGVAVLAGAWVGCYYARPSGRLITTVKHRRPGLWQAASARADTSKLLNYVKNSPLVSSGQYSRLAVAFAEGYVVRKAAMPVLVPLKLWLALWAVVIMAGGDCK